MPERSCDGIYVHVILQAWEILSLVGRGERPLLPRRSNNEKKQAHQNGGRPYAGDHTWEPCGIVVHLERSPKLPEQIEEPRLAAAKDARVKRLAREFLD